MYKIGDFIIYGNSGVCEIESIGVIDISGINKKNSYYTLKPISANGTIFAPIDTNMFMRKLITYEEIQQLIKLIPSIKEIECKEKNARLLQVHYTKFLETHKCIDLLSIISSIYDKKANGIINGKKLCQTDEKYMKIATDLINDEFSVVLGIPREDVQTYIKAKIEINENKLLINDIKH